jgi:hypothetical protein
VATHPGSGAADTLAALLEAAEPGPLPGDPDGSPEPLLDLSIL